MLAVEQQVRLKKDQLRNLLSSRKRKLAEIYEVTACPRVRHSGRSSDSHTKQLQAFQNANDLTQGRVFDEKSLPERYTTPRPPAKQVATNNNDASTTANGHTPTVGPSSTANRTVVSVKGNDTPATPRSSSPAQGKLDAAPTLSGFSSEGLISNQGDRPTTPAGQSQTGQILVTTAAAGTTKLKPAPSSARRTPSPVPPPIDTQDAHSSPASSTGRLSSRTTAPEPISPTTSPGDDTMPTLTLVDEKPPDQNGPEPLTPIAPIAPHKMSISSIDVDAMDVDPSTAFDSPVQPLKAPRSPNKITRTKPSMSIDIKPDPRLATAQLDGSIVQTPVAMSAANTARSTPATTPAVDSARRATRIQSGALLKKSVSEILGETPKSASPSDFAQPQSIRTAQKDKTDKERSRLSTVVFAKSQKPSHDNTEALEVSKLDSSPNNAGKTQPKDYMYTLFESKAHSTNRQGSLSYMLQHSAKTVTTSDHLIDYHYQSHCRILKRLYQLQNLDRWSLRQRKRAEEPMRPTSHWDFVLDHAKWMRTDFREERRWKIAAARALAEDCAQWVAASAQGRRLLQVKAKADQQNSDIDAMQIDGEDSMSTPPELVAHEEDDDLSEDIADPRDIFLTVPPAEIFSLGSSDFTFTTAKTPAFDKLLDELPFYQPVQVEPDMAKSNLAEKMDAKWRTDIVPVSRYSTEKLNAKEYKPPLKRSRYDYDIDDSPPSKRQALEPRETGVALFMPENKHIRDRIHPGHAFRPPAEHPMPSQAFFETRTASQWLASEDDEIRRQAREYSFNWTLISELMTTSNLYTSGQDRRSAWECFERWIGLEGMPADMAKTPYFKTYSGRIENAQRNVQAQWEELERRNGGAPVSNRRKTTLPVRVDRKPNRRHLFLIDGMRKLARRREAIRQKAAQTADMSAMRKPNNDHAPRMPLKTPAEWSNMKYEREQKMAKQQEMYKQQLIAHQRAVVQQQRTGQPGPAQGIPVPPQASGQMRITPQGIPNMPGMPNGHLQAPNGQPRTHPNMMGGPQGVPNGMMGHKGMPQQMANMRAGMAGSPQQIKMQQEQMARHAAANGAHSSPNIPHAAMANGQVNAQYMNGMNGAMHQGSPQGVAANVGRPSSSHIPQNLSSGPIPKINQLYASIKERNPNMTDEEVRNVATQQLMQWQQQATAAAAGSVPRPKAQPAFPKGHQAALNAAMGAANSGAYAAAQQANANAMVANANLTPAAPVGQGVMSYEQAQQYHQNMRMQQAQQNAQRGIPAPGAPMNSPMMNMARPVSQNGVAINRNSATPVPAPARDQRSASVSKNAVLVAQQQGTPVLNKAQPTPQQASPRPAAPSPALVPANKVAANVVSAATTATPAQVSGPAPTSAAPAATAQANTPAPAPTPTPAPTLT